MSPRLPAGVVPRHYAIELSPDLEAATFIGTVAIDLDIAEPLHSITLNAAELTIAGAQLVTASGEALELDSRLDAESERLTLTRRDGRGRFAAGPARLEIAFDGILNDQLHGFYRSSYTDDAGIIHTIATTQFESTDARRAFPCFDEPALKATFATTLVVDEGLLAVSNTAETAREPLEDGRVRVGFATTMPMSTYLVAFVVGPLEATEPIDCAGVPVRVIHRPGRGDQTGFALDVAAHALEWFSDYYGLRYPSDKVDLVAIPDFAFGAMENLGCVTFREVLLLVDPGAASQPELQRVAAVINHELAHMWFGDLVTMAWWEGIWLNEAFATFMETACTDAYRPDWRVWSTFCRSRASALATDALENTRPVEYPVHSPAEAEDMFDVITYEKGAALVRMLEQYLGPEAFRAGVRLYLRRHAYANTVTEDLWNALADASGQPVREIMDGWIHQGGYPAVSATATDHGLRLSQRHFTLDPRQADERRWAVPLRLRLGTGDGGREIRVLLDEPDRILTRPGAEPVTVNGGASGFYRDDPSAETIAAVASEGSGDRTASERHGLVDDAWAATLAGRLDAVTFVDLVLRGFVDERDLTVWQAVAGALGHLRRLLDGDAAQRYCELVTAASDEAAADVGLDPPLGGAEGVVDGTDGSLSGAHSRTGGEDGLVSGAHSRTGSEDGLASGAHSRTGSEDGLASGAHSHTGGEDCRTSELRATLIGLRGTVADHSATIEACRQRLDHPDPTLAAAALGVVAAHGDADDFALIRRRFETATDPQTEQRHLAALADFGEPALVRTILEGTLDGSVRTQDGPYLVRRALLNRRCGSEAWDFLSGNWDHLVSVFPTNSLSRMLEGVTALDRPELAARVHAFLAEHPVAQGAKQVAQHLERLDINVALRTRESARLAAAVLAR